MLHMSELFLMGNNNSGNYKIPLVHSVWRGVSLFNKCELTLVAANWPMWWPESATIHVKTGIRLTKNDNQRQIISQSQPAVMSMLSHRRLRTSTFASQHTKMNENKRKNTIFGRRMLYVHAYSYDWSYEMDVGNFFIADIAFILRKLVIMGFCF